METIAHVLVVVALTGAGIAAGLWRAAVQAAGRVGESLGPHVERRTGRLGRRGLDMGVEAVVGRVTAPLLVWGAVMLGVAVLLAAVAWDTGATPLAVALGLIGGLVAWRRVPRLVRIGRRPRPR